MFLGHAEMSVARARGLAIAEPRGAFACRNAERPASPRPAASTLPARRPAPPRAGTVRPAAGFAGFAARAASLRPAPRSPEEAPDPAGVLDAARRLADAGRLDEARRRLEDERRSGRVSAALFHLLATIHGALGGDAEAESSLVRAIYLEPDHAPSLRQLALLLDARGDPAQAGRLRARAERAEARAAAVAPAEGNARGEA